MLRPARLLWMLLACGLAGCLAGCSLLPQPLQDAPGTPAGATFDLVVEAPADLRALLERHLELGRWRFQGDLQPGEMRRLVSGVADNARELLGTEGYFSPQVEVHEQMHQGRRRVRVRVTPGAQARVASSRVEAIGPRGEDPAAAEALGQQWPLTAGAAFTQAAWSAAKSRGLEGLQARHHPLARIDSSQARVDTARAEVDIHIRYHTGPLVHFGPLRWQGADGARLEDGPGMARIARLPQGQPYDQALLLDAQQRLAASGYFDTVFLTLATGGGDQGDQADQADGAQDAAPAAISAPVIAHVRAAALQKWVFGLGASTDTGPRLSVDHTHNRLPWLGWRAHSQLQVQRDNPLLETRWMALPGEKHWRWFAAARAESTPSGQYSVDALQGRFGRSQAEQRIERSHYLQYNWARSHGPGAPPSGSAWSVHNAWVGRYFDSLLLPRSGWGFGLELGAGSTLVPKRAPFTRLAGRGLLLLPLGRAADPSPARPRAGRLALRGGVGAVLARQNAPIPLTQLFATGGDSSVRGYGYQSIGVRNASGRVLGGRYMALGSVEWQRPITLAGNRRDWEQALFVDAGAVANRPSSLYLRVGMGTGLRWRSPAGPLQADIAWGAQDRRWRLHLRMGFNF